MDAVERARRDLVVANRILAHQRVLEGRQAIRYNAALLFGETHASPRSTFRLQAEYEF